VDDLKVRCKTVSLTGGPPESGLEGRRAKVQAQRDQIDLLLTQGLTHAQIARRMHIGLATVTRRLSLME
jgi:DNA invertase Pin-like site-specific DNA recombinase